MLSGGCPGDAMSEMVGTLTGQVAERNRSIPLRPGCRVLFHRGCEKCRILLFVRRRLQSDRYGKAIVAIGAIGQHLALCRAFKLPGGWR